ncbi:MAG: DNA polymerase III subunit gamma/tau [Gemmatimonadota bacterium]
MSHTALARKYRPKTFADVAAQEHVSETLRKSVATDRVGHAYLFCGPRGVGKTTLARVLAMALNCPDRTSQGEPCGVCESCTRIWSGNTSLDVVEIDAASNRGVDDARSLRERAMYAPSEDRRFKVYIVDEAHMLTREAWNALLKILEEPPPRVIFVFATTEPQKIQQSAAPILSRCQRFDLRRVGAGEIERRLEHVLDSEGATASADALHALARKADGGMRDALSVLDQVLALAGDTVDLDAVRRVLGLVEEERYLELFAILAERRHADVFRLVESLVDDGYDLVEFYHGLMDTLRLLLRSALDPEAPDPSLPEHLHGPFREAAAGFAVGDLVRMLSLAADLETSGSLRRSPNPRVLIEMLLLRFSYLDRTVQLEALLGLAGGMPGPSGADAASPPAPRSGRPARTGGGRDTVARDSGAARSGPGQAAPASRPAPAPEGAARTEPTAPPPRPRPAPAVATGGLAGAWAALLASGAGVPPGLGPFLRTAQVEEGAGPTVVLRMPPGPGFERLQDPRVRQTLGDALAGHRGAPVQLQVEGAEAGTRAPERITQETVLKTRMEDLLAREPRLKEAVEELDLELLE